MNAAARSPWSWLALYAALLALMWAGTAVLREGPDPDTLAFDTQRGMDTARALIPDNRPHPSGSEANRRVAERIENLLVSYGYAVEHQAQLFCTDFAPGCTQLDNLLAIKPGRRPGGDVVLLTAHYDSAPGAPGAGDNIAGVAALLETARILAAEPALLNDVAFLFTDAEEAGLRGAQAFVKNHPLMQRVKLVLNLEARGVDGPSLMFETSVGNAALLELFGATASRPVASSLMYEAYRRMPNNTDLTIYKNAGALSVNFAFSRGVALYHSSLDDLDHLDPASLGHHGDNLLHYARLAGNTDLQTLVSEGDASYLDLFGHYLLRWPAGLNLPAAVLALLLVLGLAAATGALRFKAFAGSLGVVTLLIGSNLVAGWLLSYPLAHWPGIHALDHPNPGAGNTALFAGSVLVTLFWGAFAGRRLEPVAFLYASWGFLALLACLLAWLIPGAAYLALLPAAVFALLAVLEQLLRRPDFPTIAAWSGLIAAAYVAVYHFIFMDVLTSFYAAYLKMAPLCLAGLAAAPLAARAVRPQSGNRGKTRGPLWATIAVLAVATVAAALVPAYTPDRPRSVNVAYQQIQHSGAATAKTPADEHRWRLYTYGPPDEGYADKAGFSGPPQAFQRWGLRPSDAYLREAPPLGLAAPALRLDGDRVDGEARVLTGTVAAGRSGFLLGMSFPPGTEVAALTVAGTPVLTPENYSAEKGVAVTLSGIGDQSLPFELQVPKGSSFDLVLFELSAFPDHPEGRAIVAARPDDAASIQFSDHTEVQHHYHF